MYSYIHIKTISSSIIKQYKWTVLHNKNYSAIIIKQLNSNFIVNRWLIGTVSNAE